MQVLCLPYKIRAITTKDPQYCPKVSCVNPTELEQRQLNQFLKEHNMSCVNPTELEQRQHLNIYHNGKRIVKLYKIRAVTT